MSNSTVNIVGSNSGFCYEQPFSIGGHVKRCIRNMIGPTFYNDADKDIISASICGVGPAARILFAYEVRTDSGLYDIKIQYSVAGPVASIKQIWYVVATGAEVANDVVLSEERYRLQADLIQ